MTELVVEPASVLDAVMRRRDDGVDAVLLLGAGASVKSGMPLAGDIVSMAAIWNWCRRNGRAFHDPRLTRSDWWPWLNRQSWFDESKALADQYPVAVERLLQPKESRRDFFLDVLGRAVTPSSGYGALARLVAAGAVKHVLTTNFDGLAAAACRAEPAVSFVQLIERPADLHLFSLAGRFPQIVHLHGAVEHYEDRNLEHEIQTLDQDMRDAVLPLLRDHPLVVIGYRGAEPSIMRDLLMQGAKQVHGYRHGVYWCLRRGERPAPMVVELARLLEGNLIFVEIAGFDEAMAGWARDMTPEPAPQLTSTDVDSPIADLRPVNLTLEDLDDGIVVPRLHSYAARMGLPEPGTDPAELLARLVLMRLARRREDADPVLTRAAQILFARTDEVRFEIWSSPAFVDT